MEKEEREGGWERAKRTEEKEVEEEEGQGGALARVWRGERTKG